MSLSTGTGIDTSTCTGTDTDTDTDTGKGTGTGLGTDTSTRTGTVPGIATCDAPLAPHPSTVGGVASRPWGERGIFCLPRAASFHPQVLSQHNEGGFATFGQCPNSSNI